MQVPSIQRRIFDDSVFISGIFRSGTTITGKILGSFQEAEYSFEPPLVVQVAGLLFAKKIDDTTACEIIRSQLSCEGVIDRLNGRGLNTRAGDDSYIYNMKTRDEINARWKNYADIRELQNRVEKRQARLVFKMPAVYNLIPCLLQETQNLKLVEVDRNPADVVRSILVKQWFSDEAIRADYPAVWPYLELKNNIKAPFFLPQEILEDWARVSETTRSMLVVDFLEKQKSATFESLSDSLRNRVFRLSYEQLVRDPESMLQKLLEFTEMHEGSMTRELIATIKPKLKAKPLDDLKADCEPVWFERLLPTFQ